MAIEIRTGKQDSSWSGLVYGTPGIGKSTFATYADSPLFINIENGLNRIDCSSTNVIENYADFLEAMRFFITSPNYKTVVIDTIDALETILIRELCERNGWYNLESPGYGKGFSTLSLEFADGYKDQKKTQIPGIIKLISICLERKKNILFLGHEQVKSFAPPESDAYDRYMPKLNKNCSGILVGKLDFVFFAQYKVYIKKIKEGMGERVVARSEGGGDKEEKRIFRTCETPSWIAKNRFKLEPTIAMDATVFEKLV